MSQQHTPLSSPKLYALYMSTLYEGCMGPAVVSGCLCGRASRLGWPLGQKLARLCLVQRLLASNLLNWVMKMTTVELGSVLGLVLINWWMKTGNASYW